MRTLLLLGGAALALSASGCMRTPIEITRLTCPEESGDLRRVSVAADGKACAYRAADGSDVELRLLPVTGSPAQTLSTLERELAALKTEPGLTAVETTNLTGLKAEQARVIAEAERDVAATPHEGPPKPKESAQIDMPGLHIKAQDDQADVRVAGLHIKASGDGATIRSMKDVRLKGEATSRERRGVRAMLILAGGHYAEGYRAVGYQAAGAKTGPLTVAVVKFKGSDDHDGLYGDVKRLVRRNSAA